MPTVLVKDVLWRVAALLQDQTPQFQRWTEHELVDWLNDGQLAITKYMPSACSRIDSVRLKAGSRQSIESIAAVDCKPGDGSTPTTPVMGNQLLDVIRNMGGDGATPGKSIRLTERRVLDSTTPTWHTITAAAVSSFMYDPQTPKYFYVTPALSGPAWVEIAFTALPARITNTALPGAEAYAFAGSSTTTISISDENVDELTNYVVARANMKDAEWADGNKAASFAGMFLNSLNARVAALTGSNPQLKTLPFAPEPLARASR